MATIINSSTFHAGELTVVIQAIKQLQQGQRQLEGVQLVCAQVPVTVRCTNFGINAWICTVPPSEGAPLLLGGLRME